MTDELDNALAVSKMAAAERDDLRSKLAACERERDEFRSLVERGEGRVKDIVDAKLLRDRDEAKDAALWAFLDGAKWWHFTGNGSTAFPSEQNEMLEEAKKRYPFKPHTLVMLAENDRDLARAEAERLRGALESIAATPCTHRTCSEYCTDVCSMVRESLSPAASAAPSHDPTMPHGVVPGPTGAASSCRAHNRGDDVPGVPASLADDTMSPYRRGYERAVKDAAAAVRRAVFDEQGVPKSLPIESVTIWDAVNAIRSLLPATEREGTMEKVIRLARLMHDVFHGSQSDEGTILLFDYRRETEKGAWCATARAVLAAQGEGRGGK